MANTSMYVVINIFFSLKTDVTEVLEACQYCINKFVLTKDAVTAEHINSESTIQHVTFQYNAPISASIVWPMPVVPIPE